MRRPVIVVLAAAVLVLGASFVVWRWAEGRLSEGFAIWAANMRAQGWRVTSGTPEEGGWPLAASLTLPDARLNGGAPEFPAGLAWQAARVVLRLDLLQPGLLAVRFVGQQSVRLGDGPDLPFTADRFNVTLPLAVGAPPQSAALDAATIRFGGPVEGLTVGLLEGQSSWHPDAVAAQPALTLRLSAEAIALPPPPAPQAPLGDHIASATIDTALSGPLPPPGGPYAMTSTWRADGGTLTMRALAVGWGPLGVTGTGTLSFDEAMQPVGTARLRVVGYDDTLAALVAGHVMSAQAARAAKAVLGLMAQPAADSGGAPGVEVPLTLRDQTVSMGMFPLAKIPRLRWPDAPGSAKQD